MQAHDTPLRGMPLSDTAIRRPVLVTVLGLLAIVIGLLAYSALPVDYLPDVDVATVSVRVSYRGATPQTMIDQVVRPVEDQITTISGIKHLTAVANEGVAQLIVEFQDGVVPESALQSVRDKVNAALPDLPADVGTPVFQRFDPNDSPILQLAITGDGSLTPLQLRALISDSFVPEIEQAPGVGAVDVSGGQERQINVWLDLARLQARGIAPSQVLSAIAQANTNVGLGSITADSTRINLRAPGQIGAPADIADISIPGTLVRVGDVAAVEDGVAETTVYARLDGQDSVTLSVRKQSGTNTVEVAKAARAVIDQLMASSPQLYSTVTSDQSIQVGAAVDSSIEETILAVLAALLVVLLFFRDLRNTIVTVAGLPLIIIFTFAALWIFGLTINIISLLALSLSVGLVIDDAIVVRENIFRYMEMGESPIRAASHATAQVASSVLAMTLTIIAVFLPTAFTAGLTGTLLKSFGLTIASAMAISLVEAFTWAPMLSAHLFAQRTSAAPDAETPQHAEEALPDGAAERFYARVLEWSLRHRWAPMVIAGAVLLLSVVVALGLRYTFLPAQQSDTFAVGFQAPSGTALDETDRIARQAEQILRADPDVMTVQTLVGSSSGGASNAAETANFTIRVRDYHHTDAARERLRQQLQFLPKLTFSAQSYRGGTNTSVTNRNVQVHLQSNRSLDELAQMVDRVQQQMEQMPGFIDISSSYDTGRDEVQFTLNEAQASALGILNMQVATALRTLVDGAVATTWQIDGDDIDVVVQLPESQRQDLSVLQQIDIQTSSGPVPLATVAQLRIGGSSISLRRYDRQNEIVIGANVALGGDQNQLQRQLRGQIDQLGLPSDVTVRFGGQTEKQREGYQSLLLAMLLSIIFVYVVLAVQFESFLQPLVIMLAMPFCFLGAFVALRLAGLVLDITGMIGMIMLLGLVVKNSILLVDVANQLRRERGLDVRQALVHAGMLRLRPILMTSAAIIGGALPTSLGLHLLSSGQGSEFRRQLALVLIGGMLTSTLMTLVVVPTAYSLLDSLMQRRSARRAAPARAETAEAT